jgi:hypothetical protein
VLREDQVRVHDAERALGHERRALGRVLDVAEVLREDDARLAVRESAQRRDRAHVDAVRDEGRGRPHGQRALRVGWEPADGHGRRRRAVHVLVRGRFVRVVPERDAADDALPVDACGRDLRGQRGRVREARGGDGRAAVAIETRVARRDVRWARRGRRAGLDGRRA